MKQKTSKNKFAMAVMLIFSAFSLLLVGIFALNTSFQMKVRMPLNVTKYFTLDLNIGDDTYRIFDNQKEVDEPVETWASSDGVRIYLNGAGNPLSSITSSKTVSLKVTNKTTKYMEFTLEDITTDHENGLVLAAGTSGEIVIFHDQITEDFSIRPLVECYDSDPTTYDVTITNATSSVVRATENEDFITYLTASSTHFATIESITVGGDAITNYSYAMQTGRLVIPAESVTGAIAITCGTKIKYINADLTLQQNLTARYNSNVYGSNIQDFTTTILNHSTLLNLTLFLENTTDNTAWSFDIKQNDQTFYDYDWKVSSSQKMLIINHESLTADITISIKNGEAWEGDISAQPYQSGTGVENDPYIINSSNQVASLSAFVENGETYADSYFQLNSNIYLNDEIFTYNENTGLVRATDGKNVLYIGTSAPETSINLENTEGVVQNIISTAGSYYLLLKNNNYMLISDPKLEKQTTNSEYLVNTVTETISYGESGTVINEYVQYRSSTSSQWSQIQCWNPIGDYYHNKEEGYGTVSKFEGGFEGKKYFINGLFINKTNDDSGNAFFGRLDNAVVQNVGIEGGFVCSNGYTAGGLCANVSGFDSDVIFDSCYNKAIVVLALGVIDNNDGRVGGICGDFYQGIIKNCYNSGVIIGSKPSTGGISGLSYTSIYNSYNTGLIISNSRNVGGISGFLGYDGNKKAMLINCCNYGNVKGGSIVGGIAGYVVDGIIKNNYNYGDVKGFDCIGGIVGSSYNRASQYGNEIFIDKCYNFGYVTHTASYGGIAGYLDEKINITNCQYLNIVDKAFGEIRGDVVDNNNTTFSNQSFDGFTIANLQNITNICDALNIAVDNLPNQGLCEWEMGKEHPVFSNEKNTNSVAYNINFNANGGTCSVSSGAYNFGDVLPTPNPRDGYLFIGWALCKYNEAFLVNNIVYYHNCPILGFITETYTLYAKWSARYTVNYEMDGGTFEGTKTTNAYSGDIFWVQTPTKTGYTFAGWVSNVEKGLDNVHAKTAEATSNVGILRKNNNYPIWDGSPSLYKHFINLRTTPGEVTLTATWIQN